MRGCATMGAVYEIVDAAPSAEDYIRLRHAVDLPCGSVAAVERGLTAGWAAVTAVTEVGDTVGMGRLIGDGALFLQVVDMVVLPAHQRAGLGGRILDRLLEQARQGAPEAFVSLIADPPGQGLYARHEFIDVDPSLGMRWLGSRGGSSDIVR